MDGILHLCTLYVHYVSLGRIGELLRLAVHRKILEKMSDYDDEDKINEILHNLDRYIDLPIPEFKSDDIRGLTTEEQEYYGRELYKQLHRKMAGSFKH